MEILKASTDWAKDEIFSARIIVLIGLMFLAATVGFRTMGRSETARAFVLPTLVSGILLLALGAGTYITNRSRITSFRQAYHKDAARFLQVEVKRMTKSNNEMEFLAFKVFPMIILAAAILVFFVDKPTWRANCITLIALLVVVMITDSNTSARNAAYKAKLSSAGPQ